MNEFRGLTPDELSAWTPPLVDNIIANNILLNQGTMCIYGAEGRFKSMLALDLMYHIASGKDWFDYKTTAMPTYYFQSEIPQHPLQTRSDKYRIGNNINARNCWLATDLYEKLDTGWGATIMEKELARCQPKVLIIDPMYNSFAAKLTDESEIDKLLNRLNMWRKAYHCAIILIHHNRKEEHAEGAAFHYGTDELYGHGNIKKWLDTIIYVEMTNAGDPIVDLKLTFEKVRHAESLIYPIDIQINRNNLVFTRKYSNTVLQPDDYQ
ncbi:MAG: AAA family ATPase [Eubacteriales bacterium]|jgi:RecA-family ATPase